MPLQRPQQQSVSELNALRQRAVELRLAGQTIAQTRNEVGLSAPTIIAAVKAYKAGGWEAVAVKPRGRPAAVESGHSIQDLKEPLLRAALARAEGPTRLWTAERIETWFADRAVSVTRSSVLGWLHRWSLQPQSRYRLLSQRNTGGEPAWHAAHARFARRSRRCGNSVFWIGSRQVSDKHFQLYAHDLRGRAQWCLCESTPTTADYQYFLGALCASHGKGVALVLPGQHIQQNELLASWLQLHNIDTLVIGDPIDARTVIAPPADIDPNSPILNHPYTMNSLSDTPSEAAVSLAPPLRTLTHLQRLEAESIHIIREVVAEADNPVMLYSIGKDSAVMLHLARKAFYPAPPPFPLLHIDTTWKFKAMYDFRDSIVKEYGLELLTHINPEGLSQNVNPFTHGSALHTDIMKTQGLKQALDQYRFDFAFGGARRDEEKSRAKERVFSFRNAQHRWDAKNQRPELWKLYNTRKQRDESIRVFPLSNWTELDIWQYIHREKIPIVPLYLAAERPVVMRDGSLIMVDDERMPLKTGEVPEMRKIRFRTLGCYPLTGAVESTANTLEDIIQEMLLTRTSERQGRTIDQDTAASMEKKKQEGYF